MKFSVQPKFVGKLHVSEHSKRWYQSKIAQGRKPPRPYWIVQVNGPKKLLKYLNDHTDVIAECTFVEREHNGCYAISPRRTPTCAEPARMYTENAANEKAALVRGIVSGIVEKGKVK